MPSPPPPVDVFRMARALGRGSAIDAPKSLLGVFREFVKFDTPPDSPLTLKELTEHEDYRDLVTPEVEPRQPAFDFDLPQHDFSDGAGAATGATVRLSAFQGVKPVALIFGSYT
jgi:hypothetical protein